MTDEDQSIHDEISAAMEAHKAANVEEAVEDAAIPARDEAGRFAAKEEPADVVVEPVAKEEAPAETAEADAPIIPDKFALPPQYAKAGIKAKWSELPPEVRQELHERETDFHKQLTRQDEERVFGKRVREVVAPYEGFIKSLGAEPIQAVDYLIKTDYALRTAPPEQRRELFIKAARDYGINLFEGDGQQQAAQGDPRYDTLQQRLDRLESDRQAAIQQQQLAEQRSIEQQISDFSSRPENVFFDRVQPMMAALLESGQADSLEKAYEMAVYADPETRALQLAAQAEQSQRTILQQKSAEAAKARSASVSVTGAPGLTAPASSPSNANATLEDDIRAALQAAGRI